MAGGKKQSDDIQSLEVELATLRSLYEIHKSDEGVLISNGFLSRVESNEQLLESLSEDERAFFDKSRAEYDRYLQQEYEANQEYTQALTEAETKARELEKANESLAEQSRIADEAKQQAEESRDDIAKELEQAAQYQIQSDRQRRQFKTVQAHGYPAWSLLFILVIGVILLFWFEKPGVEVLVTVLAGVLGSTYQSFTSGFNAMFSPIVKEEKKPDSKSHGCKAND